MFSWPEATARDLETELQPPDPVLCPCFGFLAAGGGYEAHDRKLHW